MRYLSFISLQFVQNIWILTRKSIFYCIGKCASREDNHVVEYKFCTRKFMGLLSSLAEKSRKVKKNTRQHGGDIRWKETAHLQRYFAWDEMENFKCCTRCHDTQNEFATSKWVHIFIRIDNMFLTTILICIHFKTMSKWIQEQWYVLIVR